MVGRSRASGYACRLMEKKTPKDDPKPDETRGEPEEGESYEDSWYQVLKRRAEDAPADDQKTEE